MLGREAEQAGCRRRGDLAKHAAEYRRRRSVAPIDCDGMGFERARVGELAAQRDGVTLVDVDADSCGPPAVNCGATLLTVTVVDAELVLPSSLVTVRDDRKIAGRQRPADGSNTCGPPKSRTGPVEERSWSIGSCRPRLIATVLVWVPPGLSIVPLTEIVSPSLILDEERIRPGGRTAGPGR